MDRNDFLIRLGVGTAVAVSGYFLWNLVVGTESNNTPVSSDRPELNPNVYTREESGLFTLSHEENSCHVNSTGRQIISCMNGRNTVTDIAEIVSEKYSIEYSDSLVTSVAYFVSQLAKAGFLASPFYATFYEYYS